MRTVHISEADAALDFAGLMAQVREGKEIVIEANSHPLALISAAQPSRRSITECIALAKRHEAETGEAPVLDGEFVSDMEGVIRNRITSLPTAWD